MGLSGYRQVHHTIDYGTCLDNIVLYCNNFLHYGICSANTTSLPDAYHRFDLGIGILFPATQNADDRDVMVNSVAPVWDGNETWLVLGGAGLVLFGTVAASGIRTLAKVEYNNNMNLIIVATSVSAGLLPVVAPKFYDQFPEWFATIFHSGISAGAIVAIA